MTALCKYQASLAPAGQGPAKFFFTAFVTFRSVYDVQPRIERRNQEPIDDGRSSILITDLGSSETEDTDSEIRSAEDAPFDRSRRVYHGFAH